MPLTLVTGDPFLTSQQTLAFGMNLRAQVEVTPLAAVLAQQHPVALASYRKHAQRGRATLGDVWLWRENHLQIAFLIVRETAVGTTRPRHVAAATLRLAREYQQLGIRSIALAPLGRDSEQASIMEALNLYLPHAPLPAVAYAAYQPGVRGE